MNVLVTGGAGFIGANLVRHLLEGGNGAAGLRAARVVTLDKLTYAGNRANLTDFADDPRHRLAVGDIGDGEFVTRLLAEEEIDVVIHLAAESHVDRSIDGPEEFIRTNVVGTFRLLEAFRNHAAVSGRSAAEGYGKSLAEGGNCLFIHVSTDEVFGSLGENEPAVREQAAYAPNSPYSASKAGSDHLARAYFRTYGVPVLITHCSNNYGPFQFPEKLIPLMILKTLRGEHLPVYGDGLHVRDWIHVADHCRALALAAAKGKPGETFLFGGRCEKSNLEVVRGIVAAVSELVPGNDIRPADELIRFVADRPGHDRRYAIDSGKADRELGWTPRETFESGLRATVRWYLEHPEWIASIESGSYRGERLGLL